MFLGDSSKMPSVLVACLVLSKEGLGRRDMAWMQGFYFGHFDVPWGLKQDAIGPCGLLSVIQAYVFCNYLYIPILLLIIIN